MCQAVSTRWASAPARRADLTLDSEYPSVNHVRACPDASVVSDSLHLHALRPARLLCPWDSPDKNTEVGCHALLQGIFLTQGLNLGLPHCGQILYRLSHQGSPVNHIANLKLSPRLIKKTGGSNFKNVFLLTQ